MTKKLVSFDDQAEPGEGLPAVVKSELNNTYADRDTVDSGRLAPAPLRTTHGSQLVATTGDQLSRLNGYLGDGVPEVKRLVGTFDLAGPLVLPSNITLDVSAARFRAMPGTGWTTATVPDVGLRGLVEVPGRSGITIIGTLVCDCNVPNLSAGQACQIGFLMLGPNTLHRFGGIEVINAGAKDGTSPGTGAIRILARASTSGMAGEYPALYAGADLIGSVKGCAFGDITVRHDPTVKQGFAMRVLTDWESDIAWAATTVRISDNTFGDGHFRGEFGWNTVELAGTGTLWNNFGDVFADGHTITVMDFDKGASFNKVGTVTAVGVGLPSSLAGNSSVQYATVNFHGNPATANVRSIGNHVDKVRALKCDNPTTRLHNSSAAVVAFSHGKDNTVGELIIDGFLNAETGCAINIDNGATNSTVERVTVRGANSVLLSRGNSTTHSHARIGYVDAVVSGAGVSWVGAAGTAIGPVIIEGGRIESTSTTAVVVYVGPTAVGSRIGCETKGGGQGYVIAGPTTTLNGARAVNAASYSYRLQSGVDAAVTGDQPLLIGCKSVSPGTGHQVLNGATPDKVGCNF